MGKAMEGYKAMEWVRLWNEYKAMKWVQDYGMSTRL